MTRAFRALVSGVAVFVWLAASNHCAVASLRPATRPRLRDTSIAPAMKPRGRKTRTAAVTAKIAARRCSHPPLLGKKSRHL